MEVQQSRGSQYDCRTAQTGRPQEQGAQSCDETIGCLEIRGSLPGSIQDQELLLDENGLGDHGTEAARAKKPADRNDDMKEKHDEMAHHSIVARTANAGNYGAIYQFAIDRRRCSSFSRIRLFPSFCRNTRFSTRRYSITSCCRRFTQPARTKSNNCHGCNQLFPMTFQNDLFPGCSCRVRQNRVHNICSEGCRRGLML